MSLPRGLILLALTFGLVSSLAGCGKASAPQEDSKEWPTLFHHDFRGQPLPPGLMLFNQQEGKFSVEVEPEGLRIKIAKPWIPSTSGVGISTTFGFKGDFEAIATFEMLHVDIPPAGLSCGVAIYLRPANDNYKEATAIDRYVDSGSEGVRWWATDRSRKGAVAITDKVGRLALKRTGTTLHYLWAPGIQGDNFQDIGQADWPMEIGVLRLTAFMTKSPVNMDVRLLDLRIRRNGIDTPVISVAKGGLAAALLLGLVITLTLALGLWLFFRLRRRKEVRVETPEPTPE